MRDYFLCKRTTILSELENHNPGNWRYARYQCILASKSFIVNYIGRGATRFTGMLYAYLFSVSSQNYSTAAHSSFTDNTETALSASNKSRTIIAFASRAVADE